MRKTSFAILGALALVVYAIVQVRWLAVHRDDALMNIDEAGYLSMALTDALALVRDGVPGWLGAILGPGIQSPLVPALGSLAIVLFDMQHEYAFVVPLLASIAAVLGTYMLGKAAGGRMVGFLAGAAFASLPLLSLYSRTFHFGVPATAVMVFALLALIRSRGGASLRWTLLMGLLVGLLPLTRTMSMSFVPGMVLAVGLAWVAVPAGERLKAIRNLAVGAVLAGLVALSWLGPNLQAIANYLLSFGYGARATEFGSGTDFLTSLGIILGRMRYYVMLPHIFLLFVSGIVGSIMGAILLLRSPIAWRALMAAPIVQLAVFSLWGLLFLATSPNTGSAFDLPLWPAILVMAAVALLSVPALVRPVFLAGAIAVCLVPFLSQIDPRSELAAYRTVDIPLVGHVELTDGRGLNEINEKNYGLRPPLTPEQLSQWQALNDDVVDAIEKPDGGLQNIVFGFRHAFFNDNTFRLNALLEHGFVAGIGGIVPTSMDGSVDAYAAWLRDGQASWSCNLLTSPGEQGEFLPAANTANLELGARAAGYAVIKEWTAPDGRIIRLWTRGC